MQRLRDLAVQVLDEYQQLSNQFGAYQQITGLTCVSGCGACCNNPDVEVSELEMLPLALYLFDIGQAEEYLEICQQEGRFSCHLYRRHSLDGKQGECSYYAWRPAICRMFGAAGYRTKHTTPTLSVCAGIKQAMPEKYAQALIALQNVHDEPSDNQHGQVVNNANESNNLHSVPAPPMLADGRQRIVQLDYALGEKLMPINQALQKALERVLTIAAYSYSEDDFVAA